MTNNEVLLAALLAVAVFELVRARRRAAAAEAASLPPPHYSHDHLAPLLVELAQAGALNVRCDGGVAAVGEVGRGGGLTIGKDEERYEVKIVPLPLYAGCRIVVSGKLTFFLGAPTQYAVRAALGFASGLLGVHFASVNQCAKNGGLLVREISKVAEAEAAKAGVEIDHVTVGADFAFVSEAQQLLTVDLGFGKRGSSHAEASADGFRIGFCFGDEETRKLIPARNVRDAARRMFAEAAAEEREAEQEPE